MHKLSIALEHISDEETMDKIITDYLREVAEEIQKNFVVNYPLYAKPEVYRILGLSSEKEEGVKMLSCTNCGKEIKGFSCGCYKTQQESGKVCECQVMTSRTFEALKADASAKYCPYCGKLYRPEPKPLREKFSEYLNGVPPHKMKEPWVIERLIEIAENHFLNQESEKKGDVV